MSLKLSYGSMAIVCWWLVWWLYTDDTRVLVVWLLCVDAWFLSPLCLVAPNGSSYCQAFSFFYFSTLCFRVVVGLPFSLPVAWILIYYNHCWYQFAVVCWWPSFIYSAQWSRVVFFKYWIEWFWMVIVKYIKGNCVIWRWRLQSTMM